MMSTEHNFFSPDESCTTAKNAPLKFLRTDVSRKIFYNWYCESQCYAKASDTDAVSKETKNLKANTFL